MKLVYVAGPYRAKTPHGILENIRRAEHVAIEIWGTQNAALCPHLNSAFFDGLIPDTYFLAGALKMLEKCDAIVLVAGWQKSAGTLAEIHYALSHGMPVYTSVTCFVQGFQLSDEEYNIAACKRIA